MCTAGLVDRCSSAGPVHRSAGVALMFWHWHWQCGMAGVAPAQAVLAFALACYAAVCANRHPNRLVHRAPWYSRTLGDWHAMCPAPVDGGGPPGLSLLNLQMVLTWVNRRKVGLPHARCGSAGSGRGRAPTSCDSRLLCQRECCCRRYMRVVRVLLDGMQRACWQPLRCATIR
jgi:hypothetical protein